METRHLGSRVETRRGPIVSRPPPPPRLAPPLPATEDWVAGKRGFSTHCREHRSTMLPEETAGTAPFPHPRPAGCDRAPAPRLALLTR